MTLKLPQGGWPFSHAMPVPLASRAGVARRRAAARSGFLAQLPDPFGECDPHAAILSFRGATSCAQSLPVPVNASLSSFEERMRRIMTESIGDATFLTPYVSDTYSFALVWSRQCPLSCQA